MILRMADEKTAMVRCPSRAADGANIASYPELRAYSATCWQSVRSSPVSSRSKTSRTSRTRASVRSRTLNLVTRARPIRRMTSSGETPPGSWWRNNSAHAPFSLDDAYQTPPDRRFGDIAPSLPLGQPRREARVSASIDARRSPSARARGLREEFSTASADNSENRPRAEIKPRYRDGKRGKLTFP